MERIADHSSDIAEITIRMANEKYIKPLIDIPRMAELAKRMVNKSIDAYIKQDIELAKSVCSSDDEVDDLFMKITLELINIAKNDPESVEQAIDLILIAKYLERMADHATNIGEWVVFNVTGEHDHLARDSHQDEGNNPSLG
jgi:phosphate transport system protein